MSRSLLSAACAAVLLAASALAAGTDEPPAVGAPVAKPAAARIVHVYVTVLDKSGKVIVKSDARVEAANSSAAMGVPASGAKMSLAAKDPVAVQVLVPGGQCSVTLTPRQTAGGSATIVFDWRKDAQRCSVSEPAAEAKPASAPASGPDKHGTGFLSSLF